MAWSLIHTTQKPSYITALHAFHACTRCIQPQYLIFQPTELVAIYIQGYGERFSLHAKCKPLFFIYFSEVGSQGRDRREHGKHCTCYPFFGSTLLLESRPPITNPNPFLLRALRPFWVVQPPVHCERVQVMATMMSRPRDCVGTRRAKKALRALQRGIPVFRHRKFL